MSSCEKGHDECASYFINNFPDEINRSVDGITPLFFAIEKCYENIVNHLIGNNADVDDCGNYNQTSLFIACDKGYENIVKLLLQHNADVNKCDNNNQTPLFVACSYGYENVVKLLLQHNADVNKCDNYNESPLHKACVNNHFNCRNNYQACLLLISAGADLYYKNNKDQTPLDIYSNDPFSKNNKRIKLDEYPYQIESLKRHYKSESSWRRRRNFIMTIHNIVIKDNDKNEMNNINKNIKDPGNKLFLIVLYNRDLLRILMSYI